jgi:hypothetical protein
MIQCLISITMAKQIKGRKFKAVDKESKDSPVKNAEWEGEELGAISDTKLEQDLGTGHEVVLRFFEFAVNEEAFKQHKPNAQELFNSHRMGIESLLWRDGLKPYEGMEPRFMFSKSKKYYRFIITCVPRAGKVLSGTPQTLSQLLTK